LPEGVLLPDRPEEFFGTGTARKFHYSREPFRRNLLIAVLLTLVVYGLAWLLLGIAGFQNRTLYALATGFVFFAFISFRMIQQYLSQDVVMAVQPTGLYDSRLGSELVPWDGIKELVVIQRETEVFLRVERWPLKDGTARPGRELNLSLLDGDAGVIIEAIRAYKPVRLDR
jgi:hypothetical protein